MADDTSWVLDYLGQRQPIGRSTLSGLPSESGGGTAGAPVTPVAPAAPGGADPNAPIGGGIAPQTPFELPGPSAASLALKGLGVANQGFNIARIIQSLLGRGGPGFGEDTITSFLGESIAPEDLAALLEEFPGGADVAADFASLGTNAASGAADAAAAGADVAATVPSSMAGPIWYGLKSFVDLLSNEKGIPMGDPITQFAVDMMFPHLFGPSKDWLTFGPKVAKTLQATDTNTGTLAQSLFGAQNPSAVQAALDTFRQSMGQVIPGYGQDTAPGEIPGLPGATGSRHEGRLLVDPNITHVGLVALRDAALAGATPAGRLAAFTKAIEGEMAKRKAEIDARPAWNPDETGSSPGGSPS